MPYLSLHSHKLILSQLCASRVTAKTLFLEICQKQSQINAENERKRDKKYLIYSIFPGTFPSSAEQASQAL